MSVRLLSGEPAAPVGYARALLDMNFDDVRSDLEALFSTSNPAWPSDYGNYAPFMIRLAWHCAGSYRTSDGRGGCRGGRIRFEPERSWDDNTNLEKAIKLLEPIKYKYGVGLSWGDLIILAGNTAIASMGGPVLGFCAGRVDDVDGTWSLPLGAGPSGPSTLEQKTLFPCGDFNNSEQGACTTDSGLGTGTVGLIYVNPEGPQRNGKPADSALDIRNVFARMAMNDSETVSLVGGGHAFGKVHGACPNGAGTPPRDDALNPWPGLCGTGKGEDTFTSGLEGPWSSTPTEWSNEYFQNLLNYTWEPYQNRAGGHQWQIQDSGARARRVAPKAHGDGVVPIQMLTSDVAFLHDKTYLQLVKDFAYDISSLENAFAHSWYKLTTRDMGPVERCAANPSANTPTARPWQAALPPTPPALPDFKAVAADVRRILEPGRAPNFVHLAWACASSFRVTDYLGGCDGARLRFSPLKDAPGHFSVEEAMRLLRPIQKRYTALSWADLIVLSAQVSLEESGALPMPFCGGRTDAEGPSESDAYLLPRIAGRSNDTLATFRDWFMVMGLSDREVVALLGGVHSLGEMKRPFSGAWTADPESFDNSYFATLAGERWVSYTSPDGEPMYKAEGKALFMQQTDMFLLEDEHLRSIVSEYAANSAVFLAEFAAAWTQLIVADRFDGPTDRKSVV